MEDAKNMAMQPMRVWYTPRMVSVVEVFMKRNVRVFRKVGQSFKGIEEA
jgi:hypothetical protein